MRPIISVIVAAIVSIALERAFSRRAFRTPPTRDSAGNIELRYPVFPAVLRGAFAALIGGAALLIMVTPFEGVPLYGRLIGGLWFMIPAVIGVWWSVTMLTRRFVLRPDGIEVRQRNANPFARWSDVHGVDCHDYGPLWKWMTLRTGAGTMRIPLDVPGSLQVYDAARQQVPQDRWDDVFGPFERETKKRALP
jgi:hypothetical protein